MLGLRFQTSLEWVQVVRNDFDTFLQDHAANERKVAISALTLANQHPHRSELVSALIAVAREELEHLERVHDLLRSRGKTLGNDAPDPYMGPLHKAVRTPDVDKYLLDRLLLFGIVEARGCERFALLADGLENPELRAFYRELERSEARHHGLYLKLASQYFDRERIAPRLDELLDLEASVMRSLPVRPALH